MSSFLRNLSPSQQVGLLFVIVFGLLIAASITALVMSLRDDGDNDIVLRYCKPGQAPEEQVIVLFCGGRFQMGRGEWPLRGPGNRNLYEGPGRLLIDEVAEELDASVELEDPGA